MTDTRPPVKPVEGHYALLRDREVVGPITKHHTNNNYPYVFTAYLPHMSWRVDGISDWDDPDYDIIATISPADMQAAASGEIERLRMAVKLAEDTFKWYGDLHAAKPDMEKAHRNYELAQHMAAVLAGDKP